MHLSNCLKSQTLCKESNSRQKPNNNSIWNPIRIFSPWVCKIVPNHQPYLKMKVMPKTQQYFKIESNKGSTKESK